MGDIYKAEKRHKKGVSNKERSGEGPSPGEAAGSALQITSLVWAPPSR